MVRTEPLCNLSCISQLVEITLTEADGKRLDSRGAELSHLGHHRARVHATAEERAERHVGDQPPSHCIFEETGELLDGLGFIEAALCREVHLPVRLHRDLAGLPYQAMAGRQLLQVAVRGGRCR